MSEISTILFYLLVVQNFPKMCYCANVIHYVDFEKLQELDLSTHLEGSSPILIFSFPDECTNCEAYEKLLRNIAEDPLFTGPIYRLNDSRLPWLSSVGSPAIILANAERRLPYLGPLHHLHLSNAAHQFSIGVQSARLDDSNFEHDTQASTGSTTGSWLVVFDEISPTTLESYDGLSLSLRARGLNIGVVDPRLSARTAKRFGFSEQMPKSAENNIGVILLHQKSMFVYEGQLTRKDHSVLLEFALEKYSKHSQNPIPRPLMLFDDLVDWLVEYAKALEAQYGRPVLLLIFLSAFAAALTSAGLLLVICFWYASSIKHPVDSDSEPSHKVGKDSKGTSDSKERKKAD